VTAKKVLHVQTPTANELIDWMQAVREAITRSCLDTMDVLFQQAMLRIDDDVFYTVTFAVKQSLGVVFEWSGDWAVIKTSSNVEATGILLGSVLSEINNDSVNLSASTVPNDAGELQWTCYLGVFDFYLAEAEALPSSTTRTRRLGRRHWRLRLVMPRRRRRRRPRSC